MCEDKARQQAEKEYYFLQGEVGRFDQISVSIKNWCITVSFALIGTAFYRGIPELLLIGSAAALLFWLTESRWKSFQKIQLDKIEELEKFFCGETDAYIGPNIRTHFREALGGTRKQYSLEFDVMFYRNVRRPYLYIILIGIILFWLDRSGRFTVALSTASGAS